MPRHRKFLRAGPDASWLWLCGVCYCQDGLTDGFIPEESINILGVSVGARELAERLVEAGLWDRVDGGWQVHDYLDENRSAAEVRRLKGKRARAGRQGGLAKKRARQDQASPEQHGEGHDEQLAKQEDGNGLAPVLPRSDQIRSTTATATPSGASAPPAPAPPARHAPLHSQKEHRSHAVCGRVCLPAFLFHEFVRRRGNEAEIDRFAADIMREWALDGPKAASEPGEAIAFWRARYEERWPATKPTPAAPKDPRHEESRRKYAGMRWGQPYAGEKTS